MTCHDGQNQTSVRQGTKVRSGGHEFSGEYSKVFKDGSKIEGGYELDIARITNDFIYGKSDDNGEVDNMGYSDNFRYVEMVNAWYLTYDRDWSDIFYTTTGLRVEHSLTDRRLETSGEHLRLLRFFSQSEPES